MKAQENPFVGLNPIVDEGRFFGREPEIRRLTELLIAERVVLLYSPSGAGKTSLIKAGLIPTLMKRKFKVHPIMRVVEGAKNASAVGRNRYLTSALSYLEVSNSSPEKKKGNADGKKEFSDYLNESLPKGDVEPADYLNESSRNGDAGPAEVFIFDQFEEILTHDLHDIDRKREFFDRVGLALQDQRRWAIFAMREDYIAGLDPYRHYISTHLAATYRLNLLSLNAAIEAVQKTAQAAQKKEALVDNKTKFFFTDEAAEKLINNLAEVRAPQSRAMAAGNDSLTTTTLGQYVEPVHLQVVCQRLWKELPENIREITPAHIDDCGRVDTSLEGYYSDAVNRVADNTKAGVQRGIREWFDRHLLTREGLRTQVMLSDAATDRLGKRTVNELINAYLVREDKRNDVVWLELAHDRLITPVRNDNNKWFKENLSHLEACARAWDGEGRPASLLLAGAELESATDWVRKRRAAGKELMEHEKVFLAECERAENLTAMLRRRSNKYRRGLWLASSIATLFIIIAVFGGVIASKELRAAREKEEIARVKMEKADEKSKDAEKAREKANREAADAHDLAEEVVSEANKTVREMTKKAEAEKLAASQEAKRIVDAANEYVHDARVAKERADEALRVANATLEQVTTNARKTEEKEKIATGNVNRLQTLERASEISENAMKDHDNPKWAVTRLLDAMRLLFPYASASGHDDAAMQSLRNRLTDLQILLPSILLENTIRDCQGNAYNCEASSIQGLGFADNGQSLITASDDGNVYKYDLKNKSSKQTIDIDFKQEVSSVAVDPNTGQIAVGYFSGDVKIYGPGNTKTPISGHRHTVHRLLFKPEPDGSLLAAASKFWTFSVSRLKRQASPNGALDHKRLYRKPKNVNWVWAVLVKAKSTRLVNDFAFVSKANSPTLLLAAREDGRLEVLEAISGKGVSTISLFAAPSQRLGNQTGKGKKSSGNKNKPQDALLNIASSPDGNWLATAGRDGNIYVWNIQNLLNNPGNNQPVAKLPTFSGAVQSLAFSPQSNLLASAGQNKVRVWELKNSDWRLAVSRPLTGHEGVINTLIFFTEAGHQDLRLATADSKGVTKIWRIPPGGELNRLDSLIGRLQNELQQLNKTKSVSGELTSLVEEVRRYINR